MSIHTQLEILQLQGARFVPIPRGSKAPVRNGWQTQPQTLNTVDLEESNIGIILGTPSSGIVSIDFDGASAEQYFAARWPDVELPPTVAFTSTRPGRHQRLFQVEPAVAQVLALKQLKTGVQDTTGARVKHEQLELRAGAVQSVLPPSWVSDDIGSRTYQWLDNSAPDQVAIADLPDAVLETWLEMLVPPPMPSAPTAPPVTEAQALHLAETLKQHYNTLSYDQWIRVAWAFKNELGAHVAQDIMRYYWPETAQGEYAQLMQSRPQGRRSTFGTINYMIQQAGGAVARRDEEQDLADIINRLRKK